ncbi:ATP-binding protein [Streptomyces armeniacus]|uniref:ATP-binding protein n=1 Tax=Streptomyces armeniacus TaxID=83291 RepID=UPI001FE6B98C|nr:ATP-binding protein [Streptomyces armeniacus]
MAQLRSWDAPFETAAYVVAELAANAVQHGRVPGRGFRLALALTPGDGSAGDSTLRIEVTDARAERLPGTRRHAPHPDDESGRGLLLVGALADRWGVIPGPVPGKTVWAELDLASVPAPASPDSP